MYLTIYKLHMREYKHRTEIHLNRNIYIVFQTRKRHLKLREIELKQR